MADFRVSCGFFDHPKTKKLKRALGTDGVISLQRVWAYAAQNRHGIDKIYSAEEIELAVDWEGAAGKFAETLAACGWLDEIEDGYVLHEWGEHNGFAATAQSRSEAGRKAANARWKKLRGLDSEAPANAIECGRICESHKSALPPYAIGNAPSPSPSPLPSPKEEESILHVKQQKARNAAGEDAYKTKKGRWLTGKRLQQFNRFWTAFAYQKGKAEAADAFLDVHGFNDELLEVIVTAATAEAASRTAALAQGKTPKMAQGWLSGRRWEDEAIDSTPTVASQVAAMRAAKRELQ